MRGAFVSYTDAGWHYDPETRNIIAPDGAIVCRTGDSVHTEPHIPNLLLAAPKLYQALLGMVAYHDSKFEVNRQAALHQAYAELKAAQPPEL